MSTVFIIVQYLIPQHLLSRLAGWLAECRLPWIKNPLIKAFIRQFRVDMTQAAEPDPQCYASFNDFFTRALQAGIRPVAEVGIASPADGAISQLGSIASGRIFQAKGQDYSTVELLGGDTELAGQFDGGNFATIYLSPKDYHRIHMPCSGKLERTVYIPGQLFSVNQITAENVPRLFSRNERLVAIFDTDCGPMAMVLVGAMIVAGIETVWDGQVAPPVRKPKTTLYTRLPPGVELKRGDEMGRFKLGSTVILLFPPRQVNWNPELGPGSTVLMGQQIAHFNKAE